MKRFTARMLHLGCRPFIWFKHASKKKKVFISIALVMIFLGVSGFIRGVQKPSYINVAVGKHDITEEVSETGTILAVGRTDIFSPATGVVISMNIKNGDLVTAGQELFTVAASATEQEKQAAYANYLTALATFNGAQSDALSLRADMYTAWDDYYNLATGDKYENADGTPKNNERALAEFHISKDDWEAAEKNYKDQQTVVAKAQASVASTLLLYQATQNAIIKATAPGMVANLAVSPGASVAIKSVTNTYPVLTITTPGVTEVVIPLNETDSIKVAEGQEVVMDINAIDGPSYHGKVKRVDMIGTEVQGVVRYNAYIELQDADDRIRSGMSVDARIITKKMTDVLSVPNAAVKPYQGGRAVRTIGAKGDIVYVPVQIGIKGTEFTQILSGINEGTQVITALSNDQLKRRSLFGN